MGIDKPISHGGYGPRGGAAPLVAAAVKDSGSGRALPGDVGEHVTVLAEHVGHAMARFDGIDRSAPAFEQMHEARERVPTQEQRDEFAVGFLRGQGMFEFPWPDTALRPIEDDYYKWLARIYPSAVPAGRSDRPSGTGSAPRPRPPVHQYLRNVTIDDRGLETVAIDADVFEVLSQYELFPPDDTNPDIAARAQEQRTPAPG